jgi:hypothetical protein
MKVAIDQLPMILFPDQSLIKYINKILMFMMLSTERTGAALPRPTWSVRVDE